MIPTSPTIFNALTKSRRLQKLHKALAPVYLTIILATLTILQTGAQIAVRGSLTKGTKPITGTTTLTIAKPTGVVAGDVLFAEISQREVTFGVTPPAGWLSVASANIFYNSYSGVSVKYGGLLYYKVASDNEPTEYVFNLSANSLAIGCIIAFSGVDVSGATPFDVPPRDFYVSESGTGSVIRDGTLVSQALGITTVTNNAAVVMFTITGNIPNFSGWTTATAGALTELMDQNLMASDGRYVAAVGAAWRIKSSAGAIGTGRVDLSKEATNASILVALRRRPPAPTISSFTPATGCVGSSIRINGSNFTLINTVKFNGVDASFTVNSSSQITAIVPAGATTGKITVSNGGGTATSTSNFTPPVFATLSGNQEICVGNSTNFTASVSGGNWNTSDPTTATVNSAGLINGLKAGTATITYTLVSGGCTTPSTRSITVAAPPQAGTLSGVQNICVGETSTFASTIAGGTWSSSDPAIARVDPVSGVVTGLDAGTANITYTVKGTGGCGDASIGRFVTVDASSSTTTIKTACDSYTWPENGQTYTASGTYSSVKGCATEILELTITTSTSHTSVVSVCDSYTWPENGQTYTASGTYTSVKGCATEILELTITASTSHTSVVSVCDSYTWPENGQTYTASGTYTSVKGCVTEILELTITTSTLHTSVASLCDSYTWPENGQTYTASGTYTSVKGCATEILALTITASTSHTSVVSVCDSYTWPENGQTYTASGTYSSVKGCATEILELTITTSTSNTSVVSVCDSYTWPEDGQTYTTSGTYSSVKGCATEILELTITAAPTWYLDADADGYYTGNAITQCESPGTGYKTTGIIAAGDCNDDNPTINPGAKEICGNSIDDNCNGLVDENCTVCGDITSLTTTDIKSTIVTFNWVAAIDPDQWLVQYKTNAPGSKWIDVLLAGSTRSVTISNLLTKQNYMWHIKAKCGKSWTTYSTSILFTTLAGPTIASSITINNINSVDRSVKIAPNPAHDIAILQVSGYTGEISIQVMSSDGKIIEKEKTNAARDHTAIYPLKVSSYAAGMYLVIVADITGNKKTEKLLIVR